MIVKAIPKIPALAIVLSLLSWSADVRAEETEAADADPTDVAAIEARLYATEGRFVFANGRDARDIPFELESDKIYLRVRLNGQGPFSMYLDTGAAGMVLDTATARRLALPLGLLLVRGQETVARHRVFQHDLAFLVHADAHVHRAQEPTAPAIRTRLSIPS